MVNYEVDNNLTKAKDNGKTPSGCRTLLRLHRALEFILCFMGNIKNVKKEERLTSVANDAYNTTLAKYHTWLIRKGVGIAMYTLPTPDQLVERMNVSSAEETFQLISQIIEACQPVYDVIQKVYEDNDILNLP